MHALHPAQYQQLLRESVRLLFGRAVLAGDDAKWLERIKDRLLRFEGNDPEHGFVCTLAKLPGGWLAVIHRHTEEQFSAMQNDPDAAFVAALTELLLHRNGEYARLLRQQPGARRRLRSRQSAVQMAR